MKYLLDVNALVAWGFEPHEFHHRVSRWTASSVSEIVTCSITELGFARILARVPKYGLLVDEARSLLLRLKARRSIPFVFIADDHDLSSTPAWVKSPAQLTDGHLLGLAKAHNAHLATLDSGIPDAVLIPSN